MTTKAPKNAAAALNASKRNLKAASTPKGPSAAKMAELEAKIVDTAPMTDAERSKITDAIKADADAIARANAIGMNLDNAKPTIKVDGRNRPETWVLSSTPKPTKKVWVVAEEMPEASRKEVIAECIKRGIAPGTSRTQYQAWFKATRDSRPA